MQISNIDFFSRSMPISGFVPLVVDHITGEAVVGGCVMWKQLWD
jgi:hypothetical protein